jgi:hypothetical protein
MIPLGRHQFFHTDDIACALLMSGFFGVDDSLKTQLQTLKQLSVARMIAPYITRREQRLTSVIQIQSAYGFSMTYSERLKFRLRPKIA